MRTGRKIELLAPAKNLECGIEAINHGADAVYIGAPRFSARAAAGNSIGDIKALTEYAHQFFAKVYVALNTIIREDELEQAEKMAWEIYEAGADALIIQDMGFFNMKLPPLPLHASTQTDNRTIEKVKFLQDAGFSQVVLARELSLTEIKDIADHTQVALEAFVHGALCVSYSGQCYISQALSGRSANRGECAQYCRMPYTIQDADGNVLVSNKHVLSLKDLNQSEHLEELLDAGVTSLKIEGRLKDLSYVKNITAYYRRKLDDIMQKRVEFVRASSGTSSLYFVPNPDKSFNRGFTDYFLKGRKKEIVSFETPKSLGEAVGHVKDLNRNYFTYSGKLRINNGDGLCFLNERKELEGFRVNRVEGEKIYPLEMPRLHAGVVLYRNYDHEFEKSLSKKSAERRIHIELTLEDTENGFCLTALDEDACSASAFIEIPKEKSQKNQQENIRNQLSKLGNTIFELEQLAIRFSDNWFVPSSVLGNLRRQVIEALLSERINVRPVSKVIAREGSRPFPQNKLTYLGNVANSRAKMFYNSHGVTSVDPAFENVLQKDVPLMFTKHCVKYSLGYCPRLQGCGQLLKEPLYLLSNQVRLRLEFDCKKCEMRVC